MERPPHAQPKSAVQRTVDTLTRFNRARNQLIHNLWHYGFSELNQESKRLAQQAFMTYVLNVEYLGTFDEEFEQRWRVEYGSFGELEEWLKNYELRPISQKLDEREGARDRISSGTIKGKISNV